MKKQSISLLDIINTRLRSDKAVLLHDVGKLLLYSVIKSLKKHPGVSVSPSNE